MKSIALLLSGILFLILGTLLNLKTNYHIIGLFTISLGVILVIANFVVQLRNIKRK